MTGRKDDPELVAAVRDLMMIGQRLYHRYTNDVSPNRADDMERLYVRLEQIAQPIIDRNPFGCGDKYANQCPRCRSLPLSYERDPKRESDVARQRRHRENSERVSRDFNSHMIHLYNEGRKGR